MTTRIPITSILFLALAFPAQAGVSFKSLLDEMTNLSHLAAFPSPIYKTVQFSSTDRRSTAPYAPEWYANSDGFGKEPVANVLRTLREAGEDGVGRYVIAEAAGPGAIVRTWTANINGKAFVYLDDETDPIFEGEMFDFLIDPYGSMALNMGLLKEKRREMGFHQMNAAYFPIPFSKNLRVEWEGKLSEIHFYEIEVRRYPEGTEVESFTKNNLLVWNVEISKTLARLREPSHYLPAPTGDRTDPIDAEAAPGEVKVLAELEGSRTIQTLTLRLESADPLRAHRQVILKGYFDGAPQPQIEAPIGDFFGSGPGISPFETIPTAVRPDGTMICRLPMPFARSARIEILNLGESSARVIGDIASVVSEWDPERSLHFFAKWRVDHGIIAGGETGVFDLSFLSARGKGVFIGTAAMILNPTSIPTSGGNWWGEGDEKIWVDGEDFPSFFGTGSEDYFNYAWSRPDLFEFAYCSQPLVTGPDNRGFNVNLRWHILDPIPFEKAFDFHMEVFPHNRTPDMSYARIAYFYGTPELRDVHRPINPLDVRLGLDLPETWLPEAKGAAEGFVFHQAEDLLRWQRENTEFVHGPIWAGGQAVRWVPTRKGEVLEFPIVAAEAGPHRLAATLGRSPHSGSVQFEIEGIGTLRPTLDLQHPHAHDSRNHFFSGPDGGSVHLEAGEHRLILTSEGQLGREILIDFFWLKEE